MNVMENTRGKAVLCLALILSLIPDIGIKVSTFGFTWTVYRAFCFFSVFYLLLHNAVIIRYERGSVSYGTVFVLLFWIIHGLISLAVSHYSDKHSGLIELLSVINGLCVCLVIACLVQEEEDVEYGYVIIYRVLVFLVIFGLAEILTGRHWISSAFNEEESTIALAGNNHMATGFMYNMNDFSALISCLSPVILYRKFRQTKWAVLLGIIVINLMNDATTCNVAVILFFAYYFLLANKGTGNTQFKRLLFILICLLMLFFLVYEGQGLRERTDVIGAVARQVFNVGNSTGSLYRRMIMYRDGVAAVFPGRLLGLGPSSFSPYFTLNPSASYLVDPHSLLLEILFHYGIVVFILFIIMWCRIVRGANVLYRACTDELRKVELMIVIGFMLCYFMVSFASSSFLGFAYQWMLLGWGSRLLDITKREQEDLILCLTLL